MMQLPVSPRATTQNLETLQFGFNQKVQRSHVVVDLENLCGSSDQVPTLYSKAYQSLSSLVSLDDAQVVVAVGISAWTKCPNLGFAWPNSRLLVGRGVDGADLRLVEDLLDEPQAKRSSHVIIASGDGRFATPARELRESGVHVTVVAHAMSLSHRLRENADQVLYFPPLAA
jgi:hypothetical protein